MDLEWTSNIFLRIALSLLWLSGAHPIPSQFSIRGTVIIVSDDDVVSRIITTSYYNDDNIRNNSSIIVNRLNSKEI